MNLNEMSLSQKKACLVELMGKANSDINYKTSVYWGPEFEVAFNQMRGLIADYILMYEMGKIDSLDYEQKQQTLKTFNDRFDVELCKFPEFYNSLEQEASQKL